MLEKERNMMVNMAKSVVVVGGGVPSKRFFNFGGNVICLQG